MLYIYICLHYLYNATTELTIHLYVNGCLRTKVANENFIAIFQIAVVWLWQKENGLFDKVS